MAWFDSMRGSTALSSRGLGRRPLTAVTRVRIPLGLHENPCFTRVFSLFKLVSSHKPLTDVRPTSRNRGCRRFVPIPVEEEVAVHRARVAMLGHDLDRNAGRREQRGIGFPQIVKAKARRVTWDVQGATLGRGHTGRARVPGEKLPRDRS